jgi:hypothetical protein
MNYIQSELFNFRCQVETVIKFIYNMNFHFERFNHSLEITPRLLLREHARPSVDDFIVKDVIV